MKKLLTFCLLLAAASAQADIDLDALEKDTVMVGGTVFPKYVTEGKTYVNGEWVDGEGNQAFYTADRTADSPAEIAQLVADLKNGSPAALKNIQDHLADYVTDPSKAGEVVAALNSVLDNPNAFGLGQQEARGLLDKTFDAFLATDGDSRPELDFSRIDLSEKDLTGQDLRNTGITSDQLADVSDLTGANLSGLNLEGTDFSDKTIAGANFTGADLSDSNLSGQNLLGALFDNSDLSGADLSNGDFSGGNFAGADLSGANLENGDFSGSNMTGARLGGSNRNGANFDGATGVNPYDWCTCEWKEWQIAHGLPIDECPN